MRKTALSVLGCLLSAWMPAQISPFLDEKIERILVNELSGDLAFETLRITTQWHKPSASEGFFAVARYVEERARAVGLQDVRWIDQVAESAGWTCHRAEATLIEGEGSSARETRLGRYAEVATSIADNSRPADVTAELVDVGAGDRAADYTGKNVRGKIVLAYGPVSAVMYQAVWKRRAAGILSWASSRLNPLADSADQVAWLSVPEKDGPGGEKTTWAFVLSSRQGKALSDRLRGDTTRRTFVGESGLSGAPLRLRVVVESSVAPERKTAMVEARIPGTDPSLPEIVLTAHLQEEKFSANDDQSGVASILEIGRAFTRLIAEGKLPRPRRGIRFWWCDEIYSEYRYFADHPGAEKTMLANLNQDMVGAKQSVGGRVQYMARTPWSRPSYLNDVQESILDMVVDGNNGFLPAWQANAIPPGDPFTKPIFSRLGTREPFHARAVPYFDNTDHLVFDDVWVGVPGTSLTNWPDEYIHSSVDDLWQIDPTQLKRNAFIVASAAWWLATADAESVEPLAAFVAARGVERLAGNLATALTWLRSGKGTPEERYRAASDLLAVALETEIAAVESSRAVGPITAGDSAESFLAGEAASLAAIGRNLHGELDRAYGAASGSAKPPSGPDPALALLAARTPRFPVSTLHDWMALRKRVAEKRAEELRARSDEREREEAARKTSKGKAGARGKTPAPAEEPETLSPLMADATMNAIDGKRSAAEIARRVCAEALAAGWWYYGETTPARVETFLKKQAKDGLIAW
ncbi:MAG: M28 family peptidase [Thermoanaerobaculia bacterium]